METLSRQRYGHEHELTVKEISKHCESIKCRWCEETITGSAAYCCLTCSYFIHQQCADLPLKIKHPFHLDHWLVRTSGNTKCNICDFPGKISYSCEQCDYNLDPMCTISTLHQEKVSHELLHFLHKHPLKYYHVTGKNNHIDCKMCEIRMFGPDDNLCGCLECNFFLHESCAKFPQEIKLDSFHEHPVTYSPGDNLTCEVCHERCDDKSCYRCSRCGIGLHSRCAAFALPPKEGENSMVGLKHFCHEHPLSYSYAESQTKIPCEICRKQIKGAFYGCRHCRFFIHKSCRELPQVIKHPVYRQHSLTLARHEFEDFKCSFCTDDTATRFSYRCTICSNDDDLNLKIDIHCANVIVIPGLNEDGKILKNKYFSHEHPMTFLDQCKGLKIRCEACNYRIEDGPAYYCRLGQCQMWLHESCAKVPQVIEKHPLHPDDSLAVISETSGLHHCNVCYEIIKGTVTSCEKSGFKMDFHCAFRRPILKHPRHEHSLSYFETSISKGRNICDVCGKSCEFDLYHCATCKFVMHHFCLPLPRTVKSDRHVHELSLLDVFLEDDSDEYYCDLCAETRHPQHGIYYCNTCELICHIECVIPSEIENKALLQLDKEIADLEVEIAIEKDNLVAAKKNLEAVEERMKELETQYTASTQKRNIWVRKGMIL